MTQLLGLSFIGGQRGSQTGKTTSAVNPANNAALEPLFHAPTSAEVERAVQLAAAAFPIFSNLPGKTRATFLRKIAENIEALGDTLFARIMAETALPEARVKGETGRTCGQLRLFANLLDEGSWVDARVETADAARQPIPKPDLRSMLRPIGPVVVFCASNFPMAYSVAGGDTASALAAGCPVIVKAHSSHMGVSELIAGAVAAAVSSCGMPEGTFSLLYGGGRDVGQALVSHAEVKAVGFTGSRAGGRALMDIAAARPEPIPVYAEMSSINPVFVLPEALEQNGTAIANGLHSSATMGVGQFCTNPGLIIIPTGKAAEAFQATLIPLYAGTAPATMLNSGICQAYRRGTDTLAANQNIRVLAQAPAGSGNTAHATLLATTASAFLQDESLSAEVFGPCTLLVEAKDLAEMEAVAAHLEGQLTATLHATEADLAAAGPLAAAMERKAGRVIFGGFPTGVEVNSSIVHGGPYPATADGRSTSVGTMAIFRFVRPVAWQNYPQALLPAELQDGNPLGIRRQLNGVLG
jgi:2,5-dioxopentanoate dehydrogenase